MPPIDIHLLIWFNRCSFYLPLLLLSTFCAVPSAGLIVKLDRFVKTNFVRLSTPTKRRSARQLLEGPEEADFDDMLSMEVDPFNSSLVSELSDMEDSTPEP